ncbi:thioredoxin family protein [Bacillaceae bacterium SAOS 7]|nr:thioredoxin family protein [Bacillaceae bacterium SAOS 7]
MTLKDWFEKGLKPEQYVDQMEQNKENVQQIQSAFQLAKMEASFLSRLQEESLKAIVITEDWCGDAMMNVPIFLELARHAHIDVRILYRDQNLELMDQYLTNGTSRAIPIIIFFNEEDGEKVVWGPRAQAVQELVSSKRSSLPPLDHELFEQKQQEMYQELTHAFLTEKGLWQEVYRSMKTALTEKLI